VGFRFRIFRSAPPASDFATQLLIYRLPNSMKMQEIAFIMRGQMCGAIHSVSGCDLSQGLKVEMSDSWLKERPPWDDHSFAHTRLIEA